MGKLAQPFRGSELQAEIKPGGKQVLGVLEWGREEGDVPVLQQCWILPHPLGCRVASLSL